MNASDAGRTFARMATAFQLDPDTLRALDDLVATGRWATREDALRQSVTLLREVTEDADAEPISEEELAGIAAGITDADAGRLLTVDEVFDELERRCRDGR